MANDKEPIYVTKTFLPPRHEFDAYVDKIWQSHQLTNNGTLSREFEANTAHYLGLQKEQFTFVTNGTLALQLALRALDIHEGEVITTPFTYVATTSAILWERCTPVFVDIDPKTLNIDPQKIEDAITPRTKAIMPVHVFGNPCDVEAIQAIANKHKLKVIYDAAHAFGVTYKGKSLLENGDISTCSFHATKLFHTIEGGAVITNDASVSKKIDLMRRFGHYGDTHYILGINAKASEFQAAMGLSNLKYIDSCIEQRQKISLLYDEVIGDRFQRPSVRGDTGRNYAYYPIIFETENKLKGVLKELEKDGIFPRRYFYPSLNTLPYIESRTSCYISEDIAKRIACLPIYTGLREEVVKRIAVVLNKYS